MNQTPHLQCSRPVILLIACALGLAITLAAYFPGLMSPDSEDQFMQATSFVFRDWHPPIMAMLWNPLLKLHDGPIGMLLLFCTLYWGAFACMATAMWTRSRMAAWLLIAVAVSPMMINFVGTIWKDVFVTVFFLAGLAILVRAHYLRTPIRRRTAALLTLLFATAALARHNAIFGGAALAVLAWLQTSSIKRPSFASITRQAAVGTLLYLATFVALYAGVSRITHAEKTHPASSLFVYDLVGMSIRTNEWLLPEVPGFTLEQLPTCYEDKGWDLIWLKCPQMLDTLRKHGDWQKLGAFWLSAIADHPETYLRHRAFYTKSMFRKAWLPFNADVTDSSRKFGFSGTGVFAGMKAYVEGSANAPVVGILFTCGFWLILNIVTSVLLAVAFLRRRDLDAAFPLMVSLSGMLYTVPLTLAGVAPDFRYVYWGIAATLISCVLYVAQRSSFTEHTIQRND
ncbi:hypothetical protein [Xanthomonas bonasiae]|uniref:hypothetical protein n=1 Tax=Xanthomonas bonasiae TaxID=2810351 RepID=UPI00197D3807|nr:hypothetical protein [Xanthomonas bonasiae]MBN6110006.1 hypothetical protein [Xanthomonas bonasiae]